MIPVDSFVCELVQRLRFFRSFHPLLPDGRLLARPAANKLCADRCYFHRIVAHQLVKHTPLKWFAQA